MIDFFGFITTMSWRVGIALEELGLDYRFHSLHLGRGEHRTPEHATRNPMQKVPVVIDRDPKGGGPPITVFESGAILVYLAEKTGHLVPTGTRERAEFWTWFFWIVASYGQDVGLCGAAFHRDPRYRLDKRIDYGRTTYDFFTDASIAAHHRLDARLAERDYVGGAEFSLADIAAIGSTVPLRLHAVETLDDLPNLARWYERMRKRPTVAKGLALGRDGKSGLPADYEAALFDDGWEMRARAGSARD